MRTRKEIALYWKDICDDEAKMSGKQIALLAQAMTIELLMDIRDLLIEQQEGVTVAVDHLVAVVNAASDEGGE